MADLDLPYFNNTNYPLAVKQQLDQIEYTDDIAKRLRFNQHMPKEFFTRNSKVRGLLLAHDMGHGKTRIVIAIAEYCRINDPNRRIIVLLPKSLEGNFGNSIKKFNNRSDEYIKANYTFVSLNSSRMFKQVEQVDMNKDEIAYEKRLGSFMDDITKKNSLENTMLIIDEAHNLFNAITNGSKNAMALYDLIMKTRNIKLIFLSGTPIINDPFELVPCFNMARGKMQMLTDDSTRFDTPEYKTKAKPKSHSKAKSHSKPKHFTSLFSESRDEFDYYFVDRENKTIKNREKFANRIYGLTSYYGSVYFSSKSSRCGFPKELDTIVETVPMSQKQFSAYLTARDSEILETTKGYKSTGARFSSSSGGSSTYRVKSRQISNFIIPEYALGPVRGRKARQKHIHKITIDDLQQVEVFSPKMARMYCNIKKRDGEPGIVYSQFVSGEGLGIFARVLEADGWVNAIMPEPSNGFDIKVKPAKKYAMLSGQISPAERVDLIRKFNDKNNADGSIIQLMLLSGAVAEGIDLKRVRHVHITEPYWNYARINQVKTRAIRFNSHIDLPADQQNVQVYMYLSTYPNNYPKSKIVERTTDVEMYEKSLDNMQIINEFMLVLAESSIDCGAHYDSLAKDVKARVSCKICSPNNVRLFHPLINKDMELPSNCIPYTKAKINVSEISIDGTDEQFYYQKANKTIYMFDKKLNSHVPMPRSHKLYGKIMEQIILE